MSDRRKKYDSKMIRKTIRFSPDEFASVEKKIEDAGVDFTSWARSAILRKKLQTKLTHELLSEINRIGNNLNQIAKAVNIDNKKDVLLELVEIERTLKRIADDC